ncbi:hypothetical protein VKS41_004796 [Umbelopsis sp. WA50703]
MLLNGKSQAEVDSELVQLIGADYSSSFSAWVFEELDRRSSVEREEFDVEEVVMDENDSNKQQTKPLQTRMFLQALRRAKADQDVEQKGAKRASRRSASPQRKPRSYDRSRSRSPTRERPSRRYRDREDNDRASVFSRLGKNGNGRQSDRSISIVGSAKQSVFDRLGSQPVIEAEKKDKKERVRCTFWPNCSKGEDCPFWHPRTLCRDFPNCPRKANECLYIHPEAPKSVETKAKCKFWPNCTNPQCPYTHPLGAPAPIVKRNPTPCREGDNCTRPGCYFTHPRDGPAGTATLCRFGPMCQKYPNCPFQHPIPPVQHRNKQLVLNKQHVSDRGFSVAEDEIVERIPVGESADINMAQAQ